MFSGFAVYVGEKIVLMLRDSQKQPEDNASDKRIDDFISFIVVTPGGTVSWVNIGAEKSPLPNIVAMCERWDRIAAVFALSFGSLAVTSIVPPSEIRRKWCVVLS